MSDSLSIPPERLLEETRWLHALAAMLAGPNDADDLSQTAWLATLEQPAGRVRRLRPWLRTVLGHAFARQRTESTARERREVAGARSEAVPSTADLAARASLHRAVVDAVLALDEPGRSTILLRFFDGRQLVEIARIHGVPVETVRTRQRRALATLRERLDRQMGGRERWPAVVLPILLDRGTAPAAAGATTVAVATGALVMTIKAQVAIGAACLLLLVAGGTTAWKTLSAEPTPALSPAGAGGPVPDRPEPEARKAAAAKAAVPAEAPATLPAPAPSPAAGASIHARVHVSDEKGNDVPGAAVVAVTGDQSSGTTDARGDAALSFPKPCVATIRASASGFADATMGSVAVVDGAVIQVDLVPTTTMRIHIVDPEGAPVRGASVAIGSEMFWISETPGAVFLTRETDDTGTATFENAVIGTWYGRVRAKGFSDAYSAPGLGTYLVFGAADSTIPLKRGVELTLKFVNATTGAPGAGAKAWVTVEKRTWGDRILLTASDDGVITLGRPEDATLRIEATGSFRAMSPEPLKVPPEQTEVTIQVAEPAPVACRVSREDGTVIHAALLEYESPRRAFPVVAQDGLFQVEGQGLEVFHSFRFVVPDGCTPWTRLTRWKPEMSLTVYPTAKIRGQVVDTGEQPVAGALVTIVATGAPSVQHARNDRPAVAATLQTDAAGSFEADAGGDWLYMVEVATTAGPCARIFAAPKRHGGFGSFPFKIPLPVRRAGDDGVCDVGKLVVATKAGALRVTLNKTHPPGAEIVVTPIENLADQFSARRAPVRSNLTAELGGLPEGTYDVSVIPGRGGNFIAGAFGGWGTRVQIKAGETAEVAITK